MAIAMIMEAPGMTTELYDSVMEHLEWDELDLPSGFISHYACTTDDGMLVVDVWESQADFETFFQDRLHGALMGATDGNAPPLEPRFVVIHNEDHARVRA